MQAPLPVPPSAAGGLAWVDVGMRVCTVVAALLASPPVRAEDAGPPAGATDSTYLQYAKARLELARLELRKARGQNEEAGAPQVPASDIRRMEVRVAALERVVAAAQARPDDGRLEGQIVRARAALELSRGDLARLERLRSTTPQAVPEIDLERQRVRVRIAELRLALWEDPDSIPAEIDRMQIQIDQLTDQLIDVIDQIMNRRLVTPPP